MVMELKEKMLLVAKFDVVAAAGLVVVAAALVVVTASVVSKIAAGSARALR